MNTDKFCLSANIENRTSGGDGYIVTPNVEKVVSEIINQYQAGIHSFTIIGTYGTGKSCFLLNFEQDLISPKPQRVLIKNTEVLAQVSEFDIINIVGEFQPLDKLLVKKLSKKTYGNTAIEMLRHYYKKVKKQNQMLVLAIDEFGKVLEHAAKNNIEEELYFMQQLAEFANTPEHDILLLTTLHQNFTAYASKLNSVQKNEWAKVKGRFQEVVFAEPVEQLLYMAAKTLETTTPLPQVHSIYKIAQDCKFISPSLKEDTIKRLSPLDAFSAIVLTKAIQKYGQNERSLFSFLNNRGSNALKNFNANATLSYNLSVVYDYLINSFHSFLSAANADTMGWSAILVAIERAECADWEDAQSLDDAIKTVKAVGMLNLFGGAGFSMNKQRLSNYMEMAMGIRRADNLIDKLSQLKIIRYAEYKGRHILFEGTDINIEEEIAKASAIVPVPVSPVDSIRAIFNSRIVPAKSYYFCTGTPRYFEYALFDHALDMTPEGDIDGYIELIFSTAENAKIDVCKFSEECKHAIIFAVFNKTISLIGHLHKIKIYDYIERKVLIDKTDYVAIREIRNLKSYEQGLLNKQLLESLYGYNDDVTWFYDGKEQKIHSQREFNSLLSKMCKDIYPLTPVINNELINRHRLSSNISAARVKYLQALTNYADKEDLGWEKDKFPPEKTIYYTLLKRTGLHVNGEFAGKPQLKEFATLWDTCEEFLRSTEDKPRKVSELIKVLSEQPYKIKMGVLDFWIPTYLYIKRLDFSLFGNNGAYIPDINMEFFDLLKKHPSDFSIKAYAENGVKIQFFNQYRRVINANEKETIKTDKFIETVKPFFFFYNHLNEYAKHTHKFDHVSTLRFRDVLAKAKDPEKTFFEDLPAALGYDKTSLNSEQFVANYCHTIQRSIRELRSCYRSLIDRIEGQIIERLELKEYDYSNYIVEIRQRLSHIKKHLLSDKQLDFYNHAMAEFDNRQEWYQSICYAAIDQPLERLRDEQEEELVDNIIYLFRECEKYSVVSEAMSFHVNMEEKTLSKEIESKIESLLTNDRNLNIYALMNVLKKRME